MARKVFDLFVPIEPIGKGRHRTTKGGKSYPDPKTAKAEDRLRLFVSQSWGLGVLDQPLAVRIIAYMQRPASKPKKVLFPTGKPDVDNQMKLVCDSLNGLCWRDDALIVDGGVRKRYCSPEFPTPGFHIMVYTLGEEDV